MIKQILILIALTIVIILTRHYCALALNSLLHLQHMLLSYFGTIFAAGKIGTFLKDLLSFLAVPFIVGVVVGGSYALIKKQQLKTLMPVIWTVWLIMATLLIIK